MRAISIISKVISICAVLLLASTVVQAGTVTYNGTFAPSQLGNSLSTNLAQFDNSLGTLTGVQIGLSLDVNPYAQVLNIGNSPAVFTSSDWITYGFNSTDIWTISHGSDSWTLTAPTVDTGTIYGSGQTVMPWIILTLAGSNSAPVSLTASGLDLAGYIGAGTLTFGTSGGGQVHITDGGLYGGGGANLTGDVSVTYDYTSVPEPATMALLGLGGLLLRREK